MEDGFVVAVLVDAGAEVVREDLEEAEVEALPPRTPLWGFFAVKERALLVMVEDAEREEEAEEEDDDDEDDELEEEEGGGVRFSIDQNCFRQNLLAELPGGGGGERAGRVQCRTASSNFCNERTCHQVTDELPSNSVYLLRFHIKILCRNISVT